MRGKGLGSNPQSPSSASPAPTNPFLGAAGGGPPSQSGLVLQSPPEGAVSNGPSFTSPPKSMPQTPRGPFAGTAKPGSFASTPGPTPTESSTAPIPACAWKLIGWVTVSARPAMAMHVDRKRSCVTVSDFDGAVHVISL